MTAPSTCRVKLEPFFDAMSIEMSKVGDLTKMKQLGVKTPKQMVVAPVDQNLDKALEIALEHWKETKEWGNLPAIGLAAGALYIRGRDVK